MNIDAFVNANDSARIYECTYYHDPTRWNSIPKDTKEILNSQKWSGYIKYLDPEGNVSDAIKNLPNNEGGIYIFFIQGPTLPSAEMYIAYIGRALFTDGQNIKKRVSQYNRESKRNNARPKISRLFRHWKDYLYVKYFSTKDNELIQQGESALIKAILPPFNDDIPEKIEFKQARKAF